MRPLRPQIKEFGFLIGLRCHAEDPLWGFMSLSNITGAVNGAYSAQFLHHHTANPSVEILRTISTPAVQKRACMRVTAATVLVENAANVGKQQLKAA
jgi:hypothetical protein